jgi:hypothetical protein
MWLPFSACDVCLCPRGCQMSSWWITICLFIAEIYITIRAITKKTVKTVDSYHQFIFREFNKAMGNYPIQNDDYTILHTIPNRDFPSRKVWQLLTNNQSLNSQIIPNPCANRHSVNFIHFIIVFMGIWTLESIPIFIAGHLKGFQGSGASSGSEATAFDRTIPWMRDLGVWKTESWEIDGNQWIG